MGWTKRSSATIHLWADGVDTGKSVTLNERNNWQHTFEGLKKKNTDGSEIQYTVKEDAITNYDSSIKGDMENGFTVTNTNTEKISVPVKKSLGWKRSGLCNYQIVSRRYREGKRYSYKR